MNKLCPNCLGRDPSCTLCNGSCYVTDSQAAEFLRQYPDSPDESDALLAKPPLAKPPCPQGWDKV